MVQGQQQRQGRVGHGGQQFFQPAKAGDGQAGHHPLVGDGVAPLTRAAAQAVKSRRFHQAEAHAVPAAEVLHFARFGAAQALFAEDEVHPLGLGGKQLQHGFQPRQQRGVVGVIIHGRLRRNMLMAADGRSELESDAADAARSGLCTHLPG